MVFGRVRVPRKVTLSSLIASRMVFIDDEEEGDEKDMDVSDDDSDDIDDEEE